MFDTAITMCGNVLTAPEWGLTTNTGTYVMTFRFASTSRRFDRTSGQWIDGDSLRAEVACWRTFGQVQQPSGGAGRWMTTTAARQ